MLMPLELLRPGELAEVAEISGEPTFVGRMAELGVSPGRQLRLIRHGSPCVLQIGGSRFSLRTSDTEILVKMIAESR